MKTTLTVPDLIKALSAMVPSNRPIDVLRVIDPSVTEEQLFYYHERTKFYKDTNHEPISMGEAAVKMIKEEHVEDITSILGIFGYINFHYGRQSLKHQRSEQDDMISQALDQLAKDLGGKVEVVKVNFKSK